MSLSIAGLNKTALPVPERVQITNVSHLCKKADYAVTGSGWMSGTSCFIFFSRGEELSFSKEYGACSFRRDKTSSSSGRVASFSMAGCSFRSCKMAFLSGMLGMVPFALTHSDSAAAAYTSVGLHEIYRFNIAEDLLVLCVCDSEPYAQVQICSLCGFSSKSLGNSCKTNCFLFPCDKPASIHQICIL